MEEGVLAREVLLRQVLLSAGQIVREGFLRRDANTYSLKGPQDYLTETDAASELHIRQAILSQFSEDSVFGEEEGGEVSAQTWVVDPIDGTANFARGLPHFCISIGFVVDRNPILGGIYSPITNELYYARRGHGASLNGKAISVSGADLPESATVEMGWSTRVSTETYLESMEGLLNSGLNVRRCGSGALALAHVADGRSDGYCELHMNSWDCIPGLLIVSEAGGEVCEYLQTGDLREGGRILAATPKIAPTMSRLLSTRLLPRTQVPETA
ncbi:Inositol-1-monophosphatase [Pelagimonas phthalicica]|uniref:Inositol-1-monophosphatase n=1 Tax=Pelagimonas phthalicica TaxID=1037362 RepID=A0A238JFN7_9RHOB|nr:inositol monophosphatase family protein [Pelagimonas phthalicica]TDS92165.1 myo-inositol-1(or 4)-monophosphatase [Pelagimonas phthalicica]SMX29225.1 Inositol-1-monophosphatase [Pelagimonas phthalicica]